MAAGADGTSSDTNAPRVNDGAHPVGRATAGWDRSLRSLIVDAQPGQGFFHERMQVSDNRATAASSDPAYPDR